MLSRLVSMFPLLLLIYLTDSTVSAGAEPRPAQNAPEHEATIEELRALAEAIQASSVSKRVKREAARLVDAYGAVFGLRSALIVANANYSFSPLNNPINDGRALAGTLRELGFKVTLLENVGHAEFETTLIDLPTIFQEGGIGLFYYSGHAVQYRGINYLLPTDFKPDYRQDLKQQSVSVDKVLQALDQAGVSPKLVILDCSRDNPIGDVDEAIADGLASVATSGATLVAYATAPGQFASDGHGPNSPYTSALISALELPGLDVYDVFRTVRAKVREATAGTQLPWVSGSIETRIVFREAESEPDVLASDDLAVAAVHWNTIRASRDPADFNEFLDLYPQSDYSSAAAERRELLSVRGEGSPGPIVAAREPANEPRDPALDVTPCDLWSADPFDPQRVTDGIEMGLVNTRQAIRACASAVAENPASPRLNFQLGRALEIAERFEEAWAFYERAGRKEYPAALVRLGLMYQTGQQGEIDYDRARHYYSEAAQGAKPSETAGADFALWSVIWRKADRGDLKRFIELYPTSIFASAAHTLAADEQITAEEFEPVRAVPPPEARVHSSPEASLDAVELQVPQKIRNFESAARTERAGFAQAAFQCREDLEICVARYGRIDCELIMVVCLFQAVLN